jgi:hypothetical protein
VSYCVESDCLVVSLVRTGSNFHFISAAQHFGPWADCFAEPGSGWYWQENGAARRISSLLRRYGQFSKIYIQNDHLKFKLLSVINAIPFDCCCGDSMAQNCGFFYSGEYFFNISCGSVSKSSFLKSFLCVSEIFYKILQIHYLKLYK